MRKEGQIWQWLLVAICLVLFCAFTLVVGFFLLTGSRNGPGISILLTNPRSGRGGQPVIAVSPTVTPYMPQAPTALISATLIILPSYTPTLTPTPTLTFTPTATPTETLTPTSTPVPTDTPIPPPEEPSSDLPSSARVEGIAGHPQNFTLDCEARSAVDMAGYLGVGIDEIEFLGRLPKSDDPNSGFVGNYWDARGMLPPNSYGVYASPIAALLQEYGLNAEAVYGMSWDDVRAEVANGRPVMTWVVGNTWQGQAIDYTPSNGNTTRVVSFEHTVLVIGYDEADAILLDGDWIYRRPVQTYLDSWGALGNMAVRVLP